MWCKKCGAQVESTYKYCPNCGSIIQSNSKSTKAEISSTSTSKKKNNIIVLLIFLGILVATSSYLIKDTKINPFNKHQAENTYTGDSTINYIIQRKHWRFILGDSYSEVVSYLQKNFSEYTENDSTYNKGILEYSETPREYITIYRVGPVIKIPPGGYFIPDPTTLIFYKEKLANITMLQQTDRAEERDYIFKQIVETLRRQYKELEVPIKIRKGWKERMFSDGKTVVKIEVDTRGDYHDSTLTVIHSIYLIYYDVELWKKYKHDNRDFQ